MRPAPVNNRGRQGKYLRHQGAQECARRVQAMATAPWHSEKHESYEPLDEEKFTPAYLESIKPPTGDQDNA